MYFPKLMQFSHYDEYGVLGFIYGLLIWVNTFGGNAYREGSKRQAIRMKLKLLFASLFIIHAPESIVVVAYLECW